MVEAAAGTSKTRQCWDAKLPIKCSSLPTAECGLVTWRRSNGKTSPTGWRSIRMVLRTGPCAVLLQVHKSNKTGAREVNAMGGVFARRVFERSNIARKDDFLFAHLDGTPFTTKQFWKIFNKMLLSRVRMKGRGSISTPIHSRHFYATIRLQNGTSTSALCSNMGCTEPYLEKTLFSLQQPTCDC